MQISLFAGAVETERTPGAAAAPAGLFGSVLASASSQAIASGEAGKTPLIGALSGKLALQTTDMKAAAEGAAGTGDTLPAMKCGLADPTAAPKAAAVDLHLASAIMGENLVKLQNGKVPTAEPLLADAAAPESPKKVAANAADTVDAPAIEPIFLAEGDGEVSEPVELAESLPQVVDVPKMDRSNPQEDALTNARLPAADGEALSDKAFAARAAEEQRSVAGAANTAEADDAVRANASAAKTERPVAAAMPVASAASDQPALPQADMKFAGQIAAADVEPGLGPQASRPLDANALSQALDVQHEPRVSTHAGRLSHEFSLEITKRIQAGATELTVRLDPAELGRVEVKLGFDDGGVLRSVVAAESPAALEMLRREAGDLSRALADAGVRTDANSFSFGRERSGHGQDGQGQWDGKRRARADKNDPFAPLADSVSPELRVAAGRIDIVA